MASENVETRREGDLGATAKRSLVFVGIIALALFLWQIIDALLLMFIGVLIAVFLSGLAQRLSARTPVPRIWSLVIIALALLGMVAGAAVLIGPRISEQFTQLVQTLPQSIDQLKQSLQQTAWGPSLLDQVQSAQGGLRMGGNVFSRLTGVASGALGILTNVILILFAAIFFAADPHLYKSGFVLLVPKTKSERVRDALDASGHALWKWLMGKLIAMLFVGVFVTLGLMILGVPLALVLGLFAGLLDFVPFVGPLAAAAPGVLLALTIGPSKALYAALVYFAAQQIEGNILTPLVQQAEVSLPPVLVLFAVLAAGLLFGILGMIVATPLCVLIMVLVKMLYIEDALGKDVKIPGR